jgi:hypothetical protein
MLANLMPWLIVATIVVFVVWLAVVWLYLKSRDGLVKGRVGEKRVRYLHLIWLNRQDYSVFHDVYLPHPDADGTDGPISTEVDHIVISRFGIFVIETKNIDGYFSGARNDREWSVTNRSGRTHVTDNPFRQNHLHARAVAKFLDVGMTSVHSLVFMVGDCELLTQDEMGPNILAQSGLLDRIKSYRTEVFVPEIPKQCVVQVTQHMASEYHEQLKRVHRAGFA